MFAYHGKFLFVDLTRQSFRVESFDNVFARKYLGGNGFAVKLIHDLVSPEADPFAPDNILVFASGPMTGLPVWGANRGLVASISPATGGFFDSGFGGDFAWMLKRTGYDAIILQGASPSPVLVSVTDMGVRFSDAPDLWGLGVDESLSRLKEREPAHEFALIGPAGENRSVFGSIICSGKRISAAGRGGLGSVMGSKNCKGLAVYGEAEAKPFDEGKIRKTFADYRPTVRERAAKLTDMGTPNLVTMINGKGMLGTRNNTREIFGNAHKIGGEVIRDNYKVKNTACHGCGIACGKIVEVPGYDGKPARIKMAEYESIYALGPMLENDDPVSLLLANGVIDDMGMDTISFGVTLAFLFECAEKGLVPEVPEPGVLGFGPQGSRLSDFARAAARREGIIGEYLALGSEALARTIGGGSEKFLYSAKGLEMAGHSARALRMMGISYASSHRGGTHHDGRMIYRPEDPDIDTGFSGQAEICHATFNNSAIGDSLVFCRFVQERSFGLELGAPLAEWITDITGWENYSQEELSLTAERICTLEKLVCLDRGFGKDHDTLPYRVLHEPIPDGPSAGRYCPEEELETMLHRYYRLRGWDREGVPTGETLRRLSIT